MTCSLVNWDISRALEPFQLDAFFHPLTSTWPHLYSDVGLEEGEY